MKKIVIDIYGADAGPNVVIDGVAKAVRLGASFFPVIVGEAKLIKSRLGELGIDECSYEVIDTNDYISADEKPTAIFGGRDNSSMALSYEYLKNNDDCTALLSPGNTGALLVGSICRLGLISKLKFPALASALPCSGEKLLCLVDCGANVNCRANDLVSFAKMGNVFCKCFCGVEDPRVGLMSVGREKGKGTPLVQETYNLLEQTELNFIGNLEGGDMVSGYADVVVTDGFSGNLLLKNTEAAGKAALSAIETLDLDVQTLDKIKEAIIKKFDFNSRGAATFLGTKKTVVKMHGIANIDTVVASIDQILRLEKAEFSKRIAEEMNK